MRTAPISRPARSMALCCILGSVVLAEPAPQLDGFANDPIWATQARVWTLATPGSQGTFAHCYLAYDDQYLYFAADVFDPNIMGVNRTPKSRAWEDDSVRLLLHVGDPAATRWTTDTFSFTFSALGGATWSRGPLPDIQDQNTEPGWPPAWNSATVWAVGLKPGTTPNVAGSRDGGYVVETRIPWNELGVKPPFSPGSTMGVCILDICRPELALPGGRPLSTVPAVTELTPLNPSMWERVRMDWLGPLATRGLVEPLPLWLGSSAPEFLAYKSAETDPRGPWLDRAQWTARFELMRSQNLNTLLLKHSNPLIGLLTGAPAGQLPDTRPAALPADAFVRSGWFSAGDFARQRDQFRWMLAEAGKNGVNVFLMLDAGGVPVQPSPCSQPATQASTAPSTAPADPASISRAVVRLLDQYPDLAGVAAGAGFDTPQVLMALADGMASRRMISPALASAATTTAPAPATSAASAGASTPHPLPTVVLSRPGPELLIWTDRIDPVVARRVLEHYPNAQLLHSLQGGQWFQPLADRRIARFNALTRELSPRVTANPLRSIALGTLRGANSYMFWADPQWIRSLLLDVRNQGIQGFLLDVGPGEHGLAREAIADYAYNIGQQYSPQRWEARLRVYGVDQYAGQLLEAIQHVSAIMPEALLLVHDSSGQLMPQFGLSLAHCLQLPSYSPAGDGFNADTRGLLLGPLGPAWSDPLWGRTIAGIRTEPNSTLPPNAVSAREIIERIGKHVDAGKALLAVLRHLPPKNADQARSLSALLDAIELNVVAGEYLRASFQAAVAWDQYTARRGRVIDLLDPLRRSVEAFRKLAALGDRMYPQPLTFWESQIVSPPPWSAAMIRDSYVPVRGRWADRLRPIERESSLIEEAVSLEGTSATLPMWDQLNAASPEKRQTRFVFDFEKPDQRYHLQAGASLTSDTEQRISRKQSLLIDARKLPPGRHEALITDVGLVPLLSFQRYQVTMVYRVIDPGPGRASGSTDLPFEIGLRSITGGEPIGDHRCWTAPKGYLGVRVLNVPPPSRNGNMLYIALRAPSAIVIDEIQIAQITE